MKPARFDADETHVYYSLARRCDGRHPCTFALLETAVSSLAHARRLRVAPEELRHPIRTEFIVDAFGILLDLGVDGDARAAAVRWANGAADFGD